MARSAGIIKELASRVVTSVLAYGYKSWRMVTSVLMSKVSSRVWVQGRDVPSIRMRG